MDYFEQAKKIWSEEVPKTGQSLTVHGELIRSIEKLRDEAQRNGNGNRDEGHSIMLAFLAETLLNNLYFSEQTKEKIRETITTLMDSEAVIVDDGPYDYLTERVIDHLESTGRLERVVNPVLRR